MSLQINTQLTTNNGFTVPSGAYVWVQADYGNDLLYRVRAKMIFFKSKADFDAKRARFDPVQITKDIYDANFTANEIAALTYLDIHTYLKAQLELVLGANTVQIVQ